MKKIRILSILCAAALSLSLMAGCADAGSGEETAPDESSQSTQSTQSSQQSSAVQPKEAKAMIKVGVMQGPTGLGFSELMEKNERKEAANLYEFTVAGAPDELSGKIVTGEIDIACVPTNLAATLYAKTEGQVQIVSISTLGVLYLLQNPGEDSEQVTSFSELDGKTVYSTGQGATQEYVLEYLLDKAGAKAEVVYKSEHAELATLMAENTGNVEYALLPQPFVTTVMNKNEDVRIAIDVTEAWEAATDGKQLSMGAVIVRSEYLEKNPEAVENFLQEVAESVDYVNANVDEAAALAGKFEIIAEAVAAQAIPHCNIVCITGEPMRESIAAYLEVLFEYNPQSVGGSLPDEAFYYLG